MSNLNTPWWSPKQLAGRYNVSRQSIYDWIKSGKLPPPKPHPSGLGHYWIESELPPLEIDPRGRREKVDRD
jgi:predicted DNA-binding transcriptional regulator AlpA